MAEPAVIAGKYRVERRLGRGGMAEVFLARSEGPGGFSRQVVLKRLDAAIARDADAVTLFLDEARTASRLHHQHIAQVFDFGHDDDGYFLAMEFLDGVDGRALVRAAPGGIAIAPAVAIASAAALGLHHAHELAVIHRDVTGGNVFVTFDGAVKVIDFGIARAADRTTRTRDGLVRGTVAYMSPEQVQGFVLDRRSDLFSLGVVLYELVTGRRPFDDPGNTDLVVMKRIEAGVHTPARALRPDLPASLDGLLERLLEVDPALRPSSGEVLAVALDAISRMPSPDLGRYVRSLAPAVDAAATTPDLSGVGTTRDAETLSLRSPGRVAPSGHEVATHGPVTASADERAAADDAARTLPLSPGRLDETRVDAGRGDAGRAIPAAVGPSGFARTGLDAARVDPATSDPTRAGATAFARTGLDAARVDPRMADPTRAGATGIARTGLDAARVDPAGQPTRVDAADPARRGLAEPTGRTLPGPPVRLATPASRSRWPLALGLGVAVAAIAIVVGIAATRGDRSVIAEHDARADSTDVAIDASAGDARDNFPDLATDAAATDAVARDGGGIGPAGCLQLARVGIGTANAMLAQRTEPAWNIRTMLVNTAAFLGLDRQPWTEGILDNCDGVSGLDEFADVKRAYEAAERDLVQLERARNLRFTGTNRFGQPSYQDLDSGAALDEDEAKRR